MRGCQSNTGTTKFHMKELAANGLGRRSQLGKDCRKGLHNRYVRQKRYAPFGYRMSDGVRGKAGSLCYQIRRVKSQLENNEKCPSSQQKPF